MTIRVSCAFELRNFVFYIQQIFFHPDLSTIDECVIIENLLPTIVKTNKRKRSEVKTVELTSSDKTRSGSCERKFRK